MVDLSNPYLISIISGLIVVGIVSIVKPIRIFVIKQLQKIRIFFKDTNIGINAYYVKKYDSSPIADIDQNVFDKIKNEINFDEFEKITLHPQFLKIKSNDLGMKINVNITKEFDIAEIMDDVEDFEDEEYVVTVKMDADIKGVRRIEKIENFVNISDKIHEIIRLKCFPNADVMNSVIICDVDNLHKNLKQRFSDDDLQSMITFNNDYMTITSKEPKLLKKTLKKYVYA